MNLIGEGRARSFAHAWLIKCDSEEDARRLRDDLNHRTKDFNDRMGETVITRLPKATIVRALDETGIIGQIRQRE